MWKRKRIEGLLAASVYEPLTEAEQSEVDAYLAQHPARARELAELQRLSCAIPVYETPFTGDLLPGLRERIRTESAPRRWPWAIPMAVCAAVLLLLAQPAVYRQVVTVQPGIEPLTSPMEQMLSQAQALSKKDFPAAIALLETAVRTHPHDPLAGAAQLLMADLEFAHGQRYAQAYAAYAAARTNYPQQWGKPEHVARFNLLDETQAAQFEPLYQMDAAAARAAQGLAPLEEVVARYPGTLVAQRAVDVMCQTVAEEGHPGLVASLEQLRECCTNPTARAQVELALGDAYWTERGDAEQARAVYTQVRQNASGVLEQIAEASLSDLEMAAMPR